MLQTTEHDPFSRLTFNSVLNGVSHQKTLFMVVIITILIVVVVAMVKSVVVEVVLK